MAVLAQNFLRLRRAKRGFAFGSVLHSPKSATLAVAIIPVTPQEESLSRARTCSAEARTLSGSFHVPKKTPAFAPLGST